MGLENSAQGKVLQKLMTYRLFAADMDGTLLTDKKTFDMALLRRLIAFMTPRDMFFAAASGNQYQHLQTTFADLHDKIDYVAENGAVVVARGQIIYESLLPKATIDQLLAALTSDPIFAGAQIILSGRDHAYMNRVAPEDVAMAKFYYDSLVVPPNLRAVAANTPIYKIALSWRGQDINQQLDRINHAFPGVRGTSSGRGGIDVIAKHISKATGLMKLEEARQLMPVDVMAFGDNGNDLEMLRHAGCGVAVQNAISPVKSAANVVLEETNNQDAVLRYIQRYLEETYQTTID